MPIDLPAHFLPPAGWRTHSFVNEQTGHKIHYGSVYPDRAEPPSAIVVCLPGLSEFSEKYYELAHDMLNRGYAFWILDWQYQGRSGRLPGYPARRHSDGFDTDISDLHKLVTDYIKPAAVHADRGRIPLIMIGHSMGVNIGLRFLSDYPGFFYGAAFTAPFLGIYNFTWPLNLLSKILTPFMFLIGKSYVFSGKDWHEDMRKSDGTDKFSSDTVRDSLHNAWSLSDPSLRVGNPTFGWVIEALRSCAYLKEPGRMEKIEIPVLVALSGKEEIVNNAAARETITRIPHAILLEIEGAKHEILMERAEFRDPFLKAFDKMMEVHNIASDGNLKPF